MLKFDLATSLQKYVLNLSRQSAGTVYSCIEQCDQFISNRPNLSCVFCQLRMFSFKRLLIDWSIGWSSRLKSRPCQFFTVQDRNLACVDLRALGWIQFTTEVLVFHRFFLSGFKPSVGALLVCYIKSIACLLYKERRDGSLVDSTPFVRRVTG